MFQSSLYWCRLLLSIAYYHIFYCLILWIFIQGLLLFEEGIANYVRNIYSRKKKDLNAGLGPFLISFDQRNNRLVHTVKTFNRSKCHSPVLYTQRLHLLQDRHLVSLFEHLCFHKHRHHIFGK